MLRAASTPGGTGRPVVDLHATIMYPNCDIEIASSVYAYDSGIPIRKCSKCLGVWLAAGQLKQIFDYRNGPHKTDKLAEAMSESIAESNAFHRLGDLVQSRELSTVFAIVILVLGVILGANVFRIAGLLAFMVLHMVCIANCKKDAILEKIKVKDVTFLVVGDLPDELHENFRWND